MLQTLKEKNEDLEQERVIFTKKLEYLNKKLKFEKGENLDITQKLQQLEESRINFMKYNLEKMMKHFAALGLKIQNQSKVVQEQTQFISSVTDIKLFINENRSSEELPHEVNVDALNLNDEFDRHQSEALASAL